MKPKLLLLRPRSIDMLKSLTVIITIGFLGTNTSLFADTVLKWDLPISFNGTSSGTIASGLVGVSGTLITAQVGTLGVDANNSAVSTETTTWNRTGFSASDFTTAQAAGDYYSFETTVDSGYTATISGVGPSSMKKGSAGNPTVALFHSSDGSTFTQVGSSATGLSSTSVDVGAAFGSSLTGSPIIMNSGETHYWRVVAFGGNDLNTGRLRWVSSGTVDFSLTGTVTSGPPPANLVWTGSTGDFWNADPGNTNWKDGSDVATPFTNGSNVTINIPATITVDSAGVSPTMIAVANSSGAVALSGGVIAGSSLTKTGAGTFTILNTIGTQSVFGGPTGTIALNIVEGGVTFDGNSNRYLGGNMIWNAPVTMNGGLIELHGGSVGGTANIDLTANSTIGARLNYGTATVKLPIAIPAGITLDVDSAQGTNLLTLQGAISGDGSVKKTNTGEVRLASLDNYTGGTSITAGILTISNVGALGSGSASVAGGQLRVDLLAGNITNNLSLSGTTAGYGNIGKGALVVHNEGQVSTFSGVVTLDGTSLIRSYSGGGGVIFSQPIAGTGSVTFEAGGANKIHNQRWTLRGGASTLVGDVKLRSDGSANALLTLDGGSLPTASILTMEDSSIVGGNNAVLDLNGNNQTLAGLLHIAGANGLGSFITNGGSQSTLTIDGVTNSTFDGVIGANTAAGITSQSAGGDHISLVKNGGGILTLNGANTYTGDTTVNAGTLSFAISNLSDSSTVTINGGTLNLGGDTDVVGSLVIGGVSQIGGGAIYDSGNTSVITGNGKIQVGQATGFNTWVTGVPYNLSGADALPNADPDHDGITNSIEYVIGGNPAGASDTDKMPVGQAVGSNLEFTFRLTDASVYLNPSIEYGTNLSGWTTAVNGVNGVNISAPSDLGGGVKKIIVTIPKDIELKRFARLRVVIP